MPRSLNDVPLELLTFIADDLPSPHDLLALTKTSARLRHTFLDPSNVAIWRRARARCPAGPVPPPAEGSGVSEFEHALRVFGVGKCEVCGKRTRRMPVSFSVGARLCNNFTCVKAFVKDYLVDFRSPVTQVTEWLPFVESLRPFEKAVGLGLSPYYGHRFYRKTDYLAALDEYNKSVRDKSYVLKDRTEEKERLMPFIEHCKKLAEFRDRFESLRQRVPAQNRALMGDIARKQGWQLADLIATPTCLDMMKTSSATGEKLSADEIERMVPELREELKALRASRENREKERARQQRAHDIELAYRRLSAPAKPPAPSTDPTPTMIEHLLSVATPSMTEWLPASILYATTPPRAPDPLVLPPLADFKRLPALATLQAQDAPSIAKELAPDGPQHSLVLDAVKKWSATARKALAQTLGFAHDWADPSARVAHPVDRPDARFVCTKEWCGEHLDFVDACSHACRWNDRWDAKDFVKDEVAVAVVRHAAALAGVDVELVGAREKLDGVGVRWACGVCKGVAMPFSRLVDHFARPGHDAVPPLLTLLSQAQAEAYVARGAYPAGLAATFSKKARPQTKKVRERKSFACQHCWGGMGAVLGVVSGGEQPVANGTALPDGSAPEDGSVVSDADMDAIPAHIAQPQGQNSSGGPTQPRGPAKKLVLMNIDGIFSHAKSKHGIERLGDEDFFVVKVDPPL